MILSRLGVRGKLNLLLLLPLAAVVLVAVPFVADEVGHARSAATTADAAKQARQLGGLVWELQRERLVTAHFLASPNADPVRLMLQQRTVADTADQVRTSLGEDASEELTSALVRLDSLKELRRAALQRGASVDSVARAWHAVIDNIIDALRLVDRTSDADGARQRIALDSLLRANEQGSLRGMAVIATVVSPAAGANLLNDASAQAQSFIERFVHQTGSEHAGIVVLVEQGEAARRVEALAERVNVARQAGKEAMDAFVNEAFASVESQSALRRLVQDRVTSDITAEADDRAAEAGTAAWSVGLGTSLIFVIVVVMTIAVSRSIADPLHRLTRAAGAVADLANNELLRVTDTERVDEQPPKLAAIDVRSTDEVGELATAFNRVQATAALLLERQSVTRRNVSLMFANVAQRTQNLVSRQLALVDELERNEQNAPILSSLYRIDHLSTRLRRNAENLLVVAGAREEGRLTGPTPLGTALRSALAEIEDFQRVRFGEICEATVAAPLASDLVLVFAELFENATAYSPPESFVDVSATITPDGYCMVSIADHGIGMTEARLAEENRRLVERERLDIAPTSVLGLFVVGRLARRHNLSVRLVPSSDVGITSHIAIPPSLYTAGASPLVRDDTPTIRTPAGFSRRPVLSGAAPLVIPPAKGGSFAWFTDKSAERPPVRVAESPAAPAQSRRGLNRRVPGAQMPSPASKAHAAGSAGRAAHDAMATRDALDGFQSGVARATHPRPLALPTASELATPESAMPQAAAPTALPNQRQPSEPANWTSADRPVSGPPMWTEPRFGVPTSAPPYDTAAFPTAPTSAPPFEAGPSQPDEPPTDHGGLARRSPGAHLAPGLRDRRQAAPPPRAAAPKPRDPAADRAAFDDWTTGFARAVEETVAVPGGHDQ